MTPENMKKVREVFAETLYGRFAADLVFDPIIVKPDVDYYGDDYIRVLIVVDGDPDLLDVKRLRGIIGELRDKLEIHGIMEFPSPYYIDKDEYLYYLKRGKVDTL